MTKTVLPAFWRVILCLTLFPLASAAMHSYEPNAALWPVFTVPYKTFPFTTTPSVSLLPPLDNVMVIGGTPPLNAQTNLTPKPLKDLTIIGVLLRLSEASGSITKKKKDLKYDLISRKRSQYSMDYSKNCFPHYEEKHFEFPVMMLWTSYRYMPISCPEPLLATNGALGLWVVDCRCVQSVNF